MLSVLKELFQKSLGRRPIAKIVVLSVVAAHAAIYTGLSSIDSFTPEWWLTLATGSFARAVYYVAPAILIAAIIDALFYDYMMRDKTPSWLFDFWLDARSVYLVLNGIAAWLLSLAVPGLVICSGIEVVLTGSLSIEALALSAFGLTLSSGAVSTFFGLLRIFVSACILLSLFAPPRIKEEPYIATDMVKKIRAEMEDKKEVS